MTFHDVDKLRKEGMKCGINTRIHSSVVLINPQYIELGDNVRVDCFCVLSAGIKGIHVGNYVHFGCGCYLFGSGDRIVMEDFSGISSRVSIYTANDDYKDGHLTNPTVPDEYRKVATGPVILRKHAIIGSGAIIMPGSEVGVGAAVGAMTLVMKDVPDFKIVVGNPARTIGTRGNLLLELEARLARSCGGPADKSLT